MKDHCSNLFLRDGDNEEIMRCLLELEENSRESEQYNEPSCDNQELHKP
jgi:hypothetical protein